MSLQENIKKKIFSPPPESLRGGDILAVPPWIAQAGDNSQGGGSPPPENCSGGGQSPIPPPVSALVCHEPNCLDVIYIGSITVLDDLETWEKKI